MSQDPSQRAAQLNEIQLCGARTRSGASCQCRAMSNGRCRSHGGASPGAPQGAANGRYRDGYWTREAIEERKFIRSLVKGTLEGKP